jgi:hypothetical protein
MLNIFTILFLLCAYMNSLLLTIYHLYMTIVYSVVLWTVLYTISCASTYKL